MGAASLPVHLHFVHCLVDLSPANQRLASPAIGPETTVLEETPSDEESYESEDDDRPPPSRPDPARSSGSGIET